jgi:hypothetical protein
MLLRTPLSAFRGLRARVAASRGTLRTRKLDAESLYLKRRTRPAISQPGVQPHDRSAGAAGPGSVSETWSQETPPGCGASGYTTP